MFTKKKNKNKLNIINFCSFAPTKNSGAYTINKYNRNTEEIPINKFCQENAIPDTSMFKDIYRNTYGNLKYLQSKMWKHSVLGNNHTKV